MEFTIKYSCGHTEKVLAKGWPAKERKAESEKSCQACRWNAIHNAQGEKK